MNRYDKMAQHFSAFKEKYGYFVIDDDKFRYPVEDKLLLAYGELLQVDDRRKKDPVYHPVIPS